MAGNLIRIHTSVVTVELEVDVKVWKSCYKLIECILNYVHIQLNFEHLKIFITQNSELRSLFNIKYEELAT